MLKNALRVPSPASYLFTYWEWVFVLYMGWMTKGILRVIKFLMKKILSIAFSLSVFSIRSLQAQSSPELSGIYQNMILGVDPAQGVVTGYYREVFEPPNRPYLECSFYFFGKKKGANYAVQAWSPQNKKPKETAGELTFFSANNQNPSVLLRLDKVNRDCTALQPNLAKGQGAFFDFEKSGAWTEVRMVAHSKSSYYQAPELSSPTRDSAKRGTLLTMMERRSDWAQVQEDQKPKGWIRESDLYPTAPPGESSEPAPPPSKVIASPVVPAKQTDMNAPPTPKPASELESKDVLINRLKALNAQAFEMALQVLKNPTQRNALSAKKIEMEKDFNTLVSRLNNISPSAYAEESKEIFEAFLDLQYVEQAQAVVSLRLNKVIQGLGK